MRRPPMIRPTAEHLARRACRVDALKRTRRQQQLDAQQRFTQAGLRRAYRELYFGAVEDQLRAAAQAGETEVELWIPVNLQGLFIEHLGTLNLQDRAEKTHLGVRDVAVADPHGVVSRSEERERESSTE